MTVSKHTSDYSEFKWQFICRKGVSVVQMRSFFLGSTVMDMQLYSKPKLVGCV